MSIKKQGLFLQVLHEHWGVKQGCRFLFALCIDQVEEIIHGEHGGQEQNSSQSYY